MDYYKEVFRKHLLWDQNFVDDIYTRFNDSIDSIAKRIDEHCTETLGLYNLFNTADELLDFIEENGFKIQRSTFWTNITIIYTEEEEREYEEKQRLVSMYISVPETTLSYTSVEAVPRFVLEYQKLRASWPFWLRVCRRMELLRLVSTCGCRCTPVPRPP